MDLKELYKKWFDIIEDKLYDVYFWLNYSYLGKTISFIRSIPQNTKRIIDWIPVLWNNFDWDYGYLEAVIIYKLERMEKVFRSHGMCVSSETYADEMRYVLDCFEISENFELVKEQKEHEEKYGKLKMWSTPLKDQKGMHKLETKYLKCDTEELDTEAHDAYRVIMDLEEKTKREHKELAFEIIKERIEYWWD
jgi:hypothetical protein